jgi:tRNA nucleotidyltransferase (CCA-adding enzyme)
LTHDEKIGSNCHDSIDEIEKIYRELLASGRCLKLKDLAVNGQDLMRLGFREGIDIGNALSYLLDRVIKEPELNRKDILERMALDYSKERLPGE